MQPFLAYNLQTDTQTINLVWTLGFLGCLIGSLITSHIFTKYLKTSLRKMIFMSFVMFLTGLATLCIPFMVNLPLLLIARFVQVKVSNMNEFKNLIQQFYSFLGMDSFLQQIVLCLCSLWGQKEVDHLLELCISSSALDFWLEPF